MRRLLSFRGPNIFAGYLNNSEKTKEVFSDDGWFITGDLGRMDEDGFLFIEGRLSRFSKIGGEMVSHESVEEAISKLLSKDGHTNDDIICAVTGIEDESKGECLVLLSTSEVNSKWLGEELRNKGVPNLWIPKQIKQVKEIPVLGTGKLDLQNLKNWRKPNSISYRFPICIFPIKSGTPTFNFWAWASIVILASTLILLAARLVVSSAKSRSAMRLKANSRTLYWA